MTVDAAAPPRPLTTTARRSGDVAVLTVQGRLDPTKPTVSGSAVEAAMQAVEAALEPQPRVVVVDLAGVEFSRFVVGLLGLVRRRIARSRVPLDMRLSGSGPSPRRGRDNAATAALLSRRSPPRSRSLQSTRSPWRWVMDHSSLGMSRAELDREIRWQLRNAPRDPDELVRFIGHLIADVVSANNAALARQLDVGDTERPAEEF